MDPYLILLMKLRKLFSTLPLWFWVSVLLATSAFALSVYAPITLNATVLEPVSVSPKSFNVVLYPNEEKVINVTVTNVGSKPVTLDLNYEVVNVPSNGSPDDITVTSRTPFSAVPGTSVLTIVVKANNGAVAGSYTISITLSRPTLSEG